MGDVKKIYDVEEGYEKQPRSFKKYPLALLQPNKKIDQHVKR